MSERDVTVKGLIEVKRTTDATLYMEKGGDKFWVPNSLQNYILRTADGITIKIPAWFAEKTMIDYE